MDSDHAERRLAAVVAAIALVWSFGCDLRTPPRPNVLLYVIDTLRADGLGYHGDPLASTPHIDAFAREGLVFERAYAPSSWTRASMASLLTGSHPSRHGAEDRSDHLTAELSTLSERLRDAGYATAFITTNPNVGSFFGFDRGFDQMIELYARKDEGRVHFSETITKSNLATDRAIEWLKRAPRPFLLVILTIDPHTPYAPPISVFKAAAAALPRGVTLTPRDRLLLLYRSEISLNDHSFGRLIGYLRRTEVLDDTVVVLTSDHGEEFFEHGEFQHGKTLYEEVLHVPIAIRYPRSSRVAAGTRIDRPVRTVDIAPTVLDLAGMSPLPRADGTSLLGAPEGAAEPVYSSLDLDGVRLEAVIDYPWKLIVDGESGAQSLYNLAEDPGESESATGGRGGEYLAAESRLRSALERIPRAPDRESALPDTPAPEIPEEARRTLEALGYAE
ncbi:sulfatase [bacterium]|nr:sulfatase [bacterium]